MPVTRDIRGRFVSAGGPRSGAAGAGYSGGMKAYVQWTPHKLMADVKKSTIWSLGRAGAYIMGIARRSIMEAPEGDYSAPGHPPHTHGGLMKRAIQYSVEDDRQSVVIGPIATAFGDIGRLHEFGGTRPPKWRGNWQYFKDNRPREWQPASEIRVYPPRPFMGPALNISRERLPSFWANSVRGG